MSQNLSIKSWSEDDRPREKLMLKGQLALSDAELIAILIGSGSKNESAVDLSKRILASASHNLNQLGQFTLKQLTDFKGIGEAKAITILAAMELGRRRRVADSLNFSKITCSRDAFLLMQPLIGDLLHEEFWVMYLNNANKVIYKSQISKGGITSTIADLRIIFKIAFEQNAVSIILSHNHPSGNISPSPSDMQLTKKLKTAGDNLDIPVLDHIIVSTNNYFSFADNGNL
ncbi:DNA repair protein RadC [Flavobacterium branchiophilum]|uniref:DNA repair protein RadC n=1 Tax=Flavobacterium branchiophilum (strain FL-15) TaxID=1034807 RepID=G2Z3M4_FLABF|nr:DNA repair protein RadC [Flavobacterium branchiophilum]CCB70475.1 DNA repair protein RadC [Flavobacterium branchiophilum FL-15]